MDTGKQQHFWRHYVTMVCDLFVAYVEQVLLPTLHKGDIVVLDNLSSHKRVEVSGVIQSAGAKVLYLPPYSPDFNPMEKSVFEIEAMGTQT